MENSYSSDFKTSLNFDRKRFPEIVFGGLAWRSWCSQRAPFTLLGEKRKRIRRKIRIRRRRRSFGRLTFVRRDSSSGINIRFSSYVANMETGWFRETRDVYICRIHVQNAKRRKPLRGLATESQLHRVCIGHCSCDSRG